MDAKTLSPAFAALPPTAVEAVTKAEAIAGHPAIEGGSRFSSPSAVRPDSDYDFLLYCPNYKGPKWIGPVGDLNDPADLAKFLQRLTDTPHDMLLQSGWACTPIYTRDGASYTQYFGDAKVNLILIGSEEEFALWQQAQEECRARGVTTRAQRVAIHRRIIGDH